MHQLFVYGTLRKEGVSHHLLGGATVLKEGLWLGGYSLYSAGWYPLAVAEPGAKILGDVVEVPENQWPALDAYEGEGYERVLLKEKGFWLYRFLGTPMGLPKVAGGDWLSWWRSQGS